MPMGKVLQQKYLEPFLSSLSRDCLEILKLQEGYELM